MSLSVGIVGLPNVGKSTLFNALLSKIKAQAANYPFCTIEPNTGVVAVPDERLGKLSEIIKPERVVPTSIEFWDIAGLVKGASKGEGLGNQFLSHIKDTDAIIHVVRCFEDSDVIHVHGAVDPLRDVEVIETELMLADLSQVEKKIDRVTKLAKSGDKIAKGQLEVLEPLKVALSAGRPARTVALDDEQKLRIKDLAMITLKPILYVGNVSEEDASKDGGASNPAFQKLKKFAGDNGSGAISICAKLEAELAEMESNEKESFLKDLGIDASGLNRLIRAAYELLGLRTYFTAGVQEVRAWTIRSGWTAPQAAGVIHTDFERGFICAETYHYNELMRLGSVAKVKEAGLLKQEGKEYLVKDGDVILFRFNV